MVIRLPQKKIQIIIQKCQHLVSSKVTRVRKISEVLGLMTSSLQAIAPAPLHYRHLQMTQTQALLVNKSYQAKVTLTLNCLQELRWWILQMQRWNGKSIIFAGPDLTITSDASKKGLGAALGAKRVQGLCTSEEAGLHINVLELKGAVFALRTFAQNMQKVHVHLKMDNKTAVAYIQKMGRTRFPRMLLLTQEIWKFALDREIMLSVEYVSGSLNTEADWQSRNFQDSSDWQLKKNVFQQLNNRWGPFHLDLFASRHNTQLKNYVSWHPDPFAQTVDAFQRHWKEKGLYSFPPFTMIAWCLMKVQQEKASVVLIAPPWQTQPWYPSLLSMLSDNPILLPPYKDLLSSPTQGMHPLVQQNRFRLAAWKISGEETLIKGFLSKLLSCSQNIHGEGALPCLQEQLETMVWLV